MASDDTARRVAIDDLLCPSLAPLFWKPQRVGAVSSWWTHVPFAHWLVHEARPRILVELGTHNGVSYSAFCQAVLLSGLNTRCHAVDTWRGDPQSGEYGEEVYDEFRRFHDDRFAAFSTLLRCTFDEALGAFAEKSIDVLHIDGYHSFGAVTHDFESWLPKLSDQAVVLLHDTNERRDDFGVWRLFEELRERYPASSSCTATGSACSLSGPPPRERSSICAPCPTRRAWHPCAPASPLWASSGVAIPSFRSSNARRGGSSKWRPLGNRHAGGARSDPRRSALTGGTGPR